MTKPLNCNGSRTQFNRLTRSVFVSAFVFFAFCQNSSAQSISSFKKLTRPEKWWAVKHLFIAKKTFRVTQQVMVVVEEVKKDTLLDTDINGGQLDAFKHAYWMAMLAKNIHPKKAYKLGLAHEKGNYFQFKNKIAEDNILPDSVSSVMDIANNQCGIEIGVRCYDFTEEKIREVVVLEIKKGNLKVILKDETGQYLDCAWEAINLSLWKGKWGIPKCLVSSNRIYKE